MRQLIHPAVRALALTASLIAIAIVTPAAAADTAQSPIVVAQASAPAPAQAAPAVTGQSKKKPPRVEARIQALHDAFKITDSQKDLWSNVAQTMRDSDQRMAALTAERKKNRPKMSAVDDLNSYAAIVQAHAEDIQKFNAAFTPLYAAMSDDQKKTADQFFRDRGRRGAKAKAANAAAPKAN
ncbi:MAG TPA: Spy/CpxP family protein refolding chaperone [Alphaproteobacteria bacterium]|nr:Spy/CpxP family protein refolding chaperone [Alphaproteobacteria bacterium]